MRTPPRRHPPCRARRTDRHPRRVGGAPPRSRRRDLHRPARRLRLGAGGVPRGRDGRAGAPAARGVLRAGRRRGRRAGPAGNENPELPTGDDRGHRHRAHGAVGVRAAAVPARRARRGRRGDPAQAPLPRPAPQRAGRARCGCAARPTGSPATVLHERELRRGRDADAHPLHARGRPRLPGARPAAARLLVRAAAEPAAVQAAAHGRRARALLPDRPLLPRRGLPRRPPARVHPARHRDELRRAGRRDRAGRGDRRRAVVASWPATRSRGRSRG